MKNQYLLSTLLASCLLTAAVVNKPKKKIPNIIYIYADDLGYNELGCYGQTKIKTPNLDRMAREGMRFTQHYAGAPVCAPSRCMLMTGRHSGHSYIRGNYELGGYTDDTEGGQMPLAEGTFTVAHLLKQAAYTTGIAGKWGLGMANTTGSPNRQGFDFTYGYLCQKQAHNFYPTHLWKNGQWDSLDNKPFMVHRKIDPQTATIDSFQQFIGKEYAVDKITTHARQFIQQHQDKPFFLYLPYTLPHVSLQVPQAELKAYIGQFDEKPYHGENGYCPVQYPLSTYAAMISYLDKQVGLILDEIQKLGLDEQTIILFSSDNGTTFLKQIAPTYFQSTGILRGYKMDLYEGGIRVPFIVRWKNRIKPNTVSDCISTHYDMLATFADIAQVVAPANDGVSLLPTFLNQNRQKQHDYLYFEYPENGGQIAIRQGKWKAIKRDMKKDKAAKWALYNLETDLSEKQDLAAQNPELLQKFEAIVKKEHRPAHIKEWEFIDPKF